MTKQASTVRMRKWVACNHADAGKVIQALLQAKVAELALERETEKLNQAKAQLHSCEHQLFAAKQHVAKRVALARWQWAGTAAVLPNKQDPYRLPLPVSLKASPHTELVKQV